MKKEELIEKLDEADEILKDHNRFIKLLSDGPEGDLARLKQTIGHIKLLLKMNNIKEVSHPEKKAVRESLLHKQGCLVKINPCGKEYEGKTYLGFLIGDVALGSSLSIKEDKIQLEFSGHNPGIFVPEIGKIIYGCESWWGEIKDESELKGITNDDIENVWYVKILRELEKKVAARPGLNNCNGQNQQPTDKGQNEMESK
jgi:hypothetical protein